jgi:hypothetical protein
MEISNGVQALINRMNDCPEEFFDPIKNEGWSFIYKDTFRDILTEPEKAVIHTALKEVRRKEFESLIVGQIFKEENKSNYKSYSKSMVAKEGEPINFDDLRIPAHEVAKRLGHK